MQQAWEFSGHGKMWGFSLCLICSVKNWASKVGEKLSKFFKDATHYEKLQEVNDVCISARCCSRFLYNCFCILLIASGNNARFFTSRFTRQKHFRNNFPVHASVLGLPVAKVIAYEEKWNRHSEQDETAAGESFAGENRVHQGLFPLHSE